MLSKGKTIWLCICLVKKLANVNVYFDSDSFKKVLPEYDNDIQEYEIQLFGIRIQGHRVSISSLLHSTVICTIDIAYYLYFLHRDSNNKSTASD